MGKITKNLKMSTQHLLLSLLAKTPTCLAQIMEPETGGKSRTLLILQALLYGYWI